MTMKKAKIAVLVSGGGTNLQALLDAQAAGLLPHGEIALVVSSNEGAYALTRAANAGVPAETVSPKRCGGQAAFESALSDLLAAHEIDLIVLAGFLTILSADFTARWPSRILNVHPSLIPAFCGKGMYGLKVHEAALAKGVKVTHNDDSTVSIELHIIVDNGVNLTAISRSIMERVKYDVSRTTGVEVRNVDVCIDSMVIG